MRKCNLKGDALPFFPISDTRPFQPQYPCCPARYCFLLFTSLVQGRDCLSRGNRVDNKWRPPPPALAASFPRAMPTSPKAHSPAGGRVAVVPFVKLTSDGGAAAVNAAK